MRYIFLKIIIKIAVFFKISSLMNVLYNLKDDPWQLNSKSELFRYSKINELLLKNNNQNQYQNVLELGSGIGNHTEYLKKVSKKLTCLEPSKIACKKLKKKFGDEINIINSNFENMKITNHFDLIVASEVLIYTKNISEQFNKIVNNSKKFLITNYDPDFKEVSKFINANKYKKIEIKYEEKTWILIFN